MKPYYSCFRLSWTSTRRLIETQESEVKLCPAGTSNRRPCYTKKIIRISKRVLDVFWTSIADSKAADETGRKNQFWTSSRPSVAYWGVFFPLSFVLRKILLALDKGLFEKFRSLYHVSLTLLKKFHRKHVYDCEPMSTSNYSRIDSSP